MIRFLRSVDAPDAHFQQLRMGGMSLPATPFNRFPPTPLIHCPRWRGGKARRGVSGQVPDSRLRPIFDLQPEADQRRGVSEWWGRRGGGVYSVVGRGFLFCLVGRSGDGRRSYVDDAPFTIQRGFGRPGVRTLQARYPICSTAAWTRPGSAVRHGSYTWVGCTALKQPKGGRVQL